LSEDLVQNYQDLLLVMKPNAGSPAPGSLRRGAEHITDAGDGDDVLGLRGIALDLLPQAMNQLLEQLPVPDALITPDVMRQPFRRERVFRIDEQVLQQSKLQMGQANERAAADTHRLAVNVER
jgi:hypothetical protein